MNLSGGSLNDEHFLDELFALFSQYKDIVHYLCIEITESVALHDLEHTERFIGRVHDMGAKIAIDDFGAGQTSLRYLKKLSVDALKIDGEFVRTMCNHPADIAIVEAIISSRVISARASPNGSKIYKLCRRSRSWASTTCRDLQSLNRRKLATFSRPPPPRSFVSDADVKRYWRPRILRRANASL